MTKDGSNARKRAARDHAAAHHVRYTEALRATAGSPRARVRPPVPIRTSDIALIGHTSGIWSIAFHPDGTSFASAGDVTVRLWDLATRQTTSVLDTDDTVISMAWSPDGGTIAVGSVDGTVTFWTIATGEVVTRRACSGYVNAVAFGPRGDLVAACGFDRIESPGDTNAVLRLWRVSTGQDVLLAERRGDSNRGDRLVSHGYAVAFHPAGRLLATSGERDGSLHVWDLSTRRLTELPGHGTTSILALAFSPDGRSLATGGMDTTIRLWDVATWRNPVLISPQADQVAAVAFSPGSSVLASSGADPTVRLWEPTTGQPVAVLHGHDGPVRGFAFSLDGRTLVTGSEDRTVRLWNLD